jgi:hypothetical protein
MTNVQMLKFGRLILINRCLDLYTFAKQTSHPVRKEYYALKKMFNVVSSRKNIIPKTL